MKPSQEIYLRSKESTAVLPGLNRKQIRYTVAKVTKKRVNKNRRRKSLRNHLAPDAFPDVRAVGDKKPGSIFYIYPPPPPHLPGNTCMEMEQIYFYVKKTIDPCNQHFGADLFWAPASNPHSAHKRSRNQLFWAGAEAPKLKNFAGSATQETVHGKKSNDARYRYRYRKFGFNWSFSPHLKPLKNGGIS